jgi:hypothetical protein
MVKDANGITVPDSILIFYTGEVYKLSITFVKFNRKNRFKLRIGATKRTATYGGVTEIAAVYDTLLDLTNYGATAPVPNTKFKFRFRIGSIPDPIQGLTSHVPMRITALMVSQGTDITPPTIQPCLVRNA